jgi:hypothetical protein
MKKKGEPFSRIIDRDKGETLSLIMEDDKESSFS